MAFINNRYSLLCFILLISVFSVASVFASTPVLDVRVTEYISEIVAYDQTLTDGSSVISDAYNESGENNTGTSRTGHTLSVFTITGMVNITNVETLGNETVVSLNVTLNGTNYINAITLYSGPSYLVYNISTGDQPSNDNNVSIYIAELRKNDSATFNFTVTGTGLGEPLNFTESYSSWRMMTGNATEIVLNATNSFPKNVLLYDLEVYKTPSCYPNNDGGESCFTFTDLAGEDRYNASLYNQSGKSIINWNSSGGNLESNESRQITFRAWAPTNLTYYWNNSADWATWLNMGNLSASFKFNGSMSGIELINVSGIVPSARFAVSKDRVNETHWNATFNITNDASAAIDYNLTKISVWATKYQQFDDPGNINLWVNQSNVSAFGFGSTLGPYVNATWWPNLLLEQDISNSSYNIVFNYSLVPIVWATANFMIADDGTQIFKLNKTETLEDGYLFIEEIYVLLGGYLVKVTKNINPIDLSPAINHTYIVNLTVENVGLEKTPEWVSMFDLIPKDFHPLQWGNTPATLRNITDPSGAEVVVQVTDRAGNWGTLANAVSSGTVLGYSDTGAISSGTYDGYWGYHIDFNGLNATSDGNGFYTGSMPDKEVAVAYKIMGNTTVSRIDNAYIVGVDPIRLEGANPSRTVASNLTASSTTMEYVVLIASLIISVAVLSLGFGFLKK